MLNDLCSSVVFDSIYQQMKCHDEPIVLLYDTDCELAKMLSESYIQHLPSQAEKIAYDETKKDEVIAMLRALPSGANVFLVQSTNFRLDDFRIRLQLFNNGVGCLEHALLSTIPKNMMHTYLDAFAWRGEYYLQRGSFIADAMASSSEMIVYSGENSVLKFGAMEAAKINDGRFYAQKNRGGGAICGEVFSEAKDFSTVSGTITINAYPNEHFQMLWCDPFILTIEESFIVSYSDNTPQEFIENIFNRVKNGEEGKVMVRETGFGLNPALSYKTPLPYVNMCERMIGFHLSVGKKHNIYRDKFSKEVIQRFHIDIFADVKKITCDDTVIFPEM